MIYRPSDRGRASCASCRFYAPGDPLGECRVAAPQLASLRYTLIQELGVVASARRPWPSVAPHDWCALYFDEQDGNEGTGE
jgi:hypothetical protein